MASQKETLDYPSISKEHEPVSLSETAATHPSELVVESQSDSPTMLTQAYAYQNDTLSDATSHSSDEFDWEAEDDVVKNDSEGNRETAARRGRALWLMFMKLHKLIRVVLIALIGVGIFISPYLIFKFKFKNNIARAHVRMFSLWFSISWAAGSGTYLIVDLLPAVVMWFTPVLTDHVARTKMHLELASAVSGWLKLALDISWTWITLSLLRAFLHPPGAYWTTLDRVMQALFSAGVLMLAEKLFLNLVAIRFHRKALADRLAQNRFGLKVLDRLSNAQPVVSRTPPVGKKAARFSGTPRSITTPIELIGMQWQTSKSKEEPQSTSVREKQHNASTKTVHTKHNPRRRKRQKGVASVIVDHLGDALGLHQQGNLGSLHSAKKLARQLFSALSDVTPPRDHLVVSDFYPYFPSPAEARAAFELFDKDSNGDISKREMREAVQRIYRERKSLTASLKDVDSAVAKLDAVLIAIALLALLFICLLVFNPSDTLTSLVPLASIVLGFSFIFGHSAQMLFESMIFIFSTHVFDVGDLVMIDDQVLTVREFGLFSTIFRRLDGQEIIAPNALLASSKLVHNLRRSNSMWEETSLTISWDTPLEIVEQLRQRIQEFVAQNNRGWSNCAVNIDKMEYQNTISLVIAIEHRPNWQDWGGRWERRNAFMRYLKTVLEELDVRYTMPVQPVLLPEQPPFPLHMPKPKQSSSTSAHGEVFGNAGYFQGSEQRGKAPGPTIRSGGDRF